MPSSFSCPASEMCTWCAFSSTQKSPSPFSSGCRVSSCGHFVDADVGVGVVLGGPGDDQRRARLVDQDRVDFVDDRIVEPALASVRDRVLHVVAQVIEAELVVRSVGDVGRIGRALVLVRLLGQDHPHRHAEEGVDLAHPLRVATGQVVVDGDDVHALARQRVEVGRQRRHQRLALAGPHLGDLAGVQHHAADQLHIEVAHAERALGRLADDREGLGQQGIELFARRHAAAKLVGLGAQRLVRQRRHLRFERVDALDVALVGLEQPLVAAAENLREKTGNHARHGSRWRVAAQK